MGVEAAPGPSFAGVKVLYLSGVRGSSALSSSKLLGVKRELGDEGKHLTRAGPEVGSPGRALSRNGEGRGPPGLEISLASSVPIPQRRANILTELDHAYRT